MAIINILLLSYSISTGAFESPDLFLSWHTIAIANIINIELISLLKQGGLRLHTLTSVEFQQCGRLGSGEPERQFPRYVMWINALYCCCIRKP